MPAASPNRGPSSDASRATDDGVSVVVPVYNAADTLDELVNRVDAALIDLEHEIVLVNDGSADQSWDRIESLAESRPGVRGVDLMRNYGQHNALLAGVRQARHGVVVTMDDDLQHPPEEIPRLLGELDAGYDAVYGEPERIRHARWRGVASRLTKVALEKAMGAETATRIDSFRAFRTRLRDGFATYRGPYVSIDALLTWSTRNFGSVSYRHDPREAGESNYSALGLVKHALSMITAFSTRPLQLASIVGFASVVFGLLVLAYVLGDYLLSSQEVPGFAFLASLISILAGAQMFALGVMGEYLARIHVRAMERPPYTIRSRIPSRDAARGSVDLAEPLDTEITPPPSAAGE